MIAARATEAGDAAATLASAAQELAVHMAGIDRRYRLRGLTVPSPNDKQALADRFWSFAAALDRCESAGAASESLREQCRQLLDGWLFRSRCWNRAYYKPHGFAGDFRLIEWLYDLEDAKDDPCQPAIVNCLDYLLSTIPGTMSLWERRRWFEELLQQEHRRCPNGLRVLDVAAGGARYVRDFLAGLPTAAGVDVTLIDQDPAATAFCQAWSSSSREAQVRSYTLAISRLGGELADREFDVVLSAGLFDYLNDATASLLLEQLSSLLAPGGVLAFSNFHPEDPSRLVKGWLADWHLLYRDEQSCASLLPASLAITTARSANRALTYASGRRGGNNG
jgi:SAM-dependent methyltransferase